VTFVPADGECLPIAVNPGLHSRDKGQRPPVVVTELAHFEDVVGASLDAILFGLASRAVDRWREEACRLLALFF